MDLLTSLLSWWKCHLADLKSAGLFPRNLFLNSLKNLNIVTLTLSLWPINSGLFTSLLLPNLSSFLTESVPSLNLLCHSKTDARFMQDAPKAVWSIPYVFVEAFFPSLYQNFIAYRSFKVSSRLDCIFEIHHQWQSGFSRVYSNCCCSWSFESETIKIGQSSHKMYSNNILNFQESVTILNACTKKSGNLLNSRRKCSSLLTTPTRKLSRTSIRLPPVFSWNNAKYLWSTDCGQRRSFWWKKSFFLLLV